MPNVKKVPIKGGGGGAPLKGDKGARSIYSIIDEKVNEAFGGAAATTAAAAKAKSAKTKSAKAKSAKEKSAKSAGEPDVGAAIPIKSLSEENKKNLKELI